jgi:glycosyltransferase involved in cell wall biosynthesis
MKIAQVAPLIESVPPKLYGGTERVVSYLTEALTSKGHEVTLFASGDSQTSAQLQSVIDQALRLHPEQPDPLAWQIIQLEQLRRQASQFDIIHFHIDIINFPLTCLIKTPSVTTLHGRLDLPHMPTFFSLFPHVPVISISDSQRTPLPFAHWKGTVYNGIPPESYHFNASPVGYLAFLGRIAPEKGIEQAIEIAYRSGRPLRIAAKIDKVYADYFETRVKPHLKNSFIEFLGEVNEREKVCFLGNAAALLFPIDWPEPFGLTMTEAMACGTPVIAYRRGSVPEVMRDGVSGFIVDDLEGALIALKNIDQISRPGVRRYFEEHFTDGQMADAYCKIYNELVQVDPIVLPSAKKIAFT